MHALNFLSTYLNAVYNLSKLHATAGSVSLFPSLVKRCTYQWHQQSIFIASPKYQPSVRHEQANIFSPSPNLNPDPTMIEKNHNPTDPAWRQYLGPHARKSEEIHSERRRARRVDRVEEIFEEQNHGRVILPFMFSSFVQRHPIHHGHSLFVSRTRRRKTGRGHSQRKSVEHNVLRSKDGR